MKSYNKNYAKGYMKKEKKANILTNLIGEALFMFVIATASIVLYDMYINIDVVPETSYIPKQVSKEVNTENTNDVSQMLEDVSKSVVGISKIVANDTSIFSINSEKTLSMGSGIIVSDNGYILTNEHVSGGRYSKCYVSIAGDSNEYPGTVVWSDSDIDLAIVKIDKLGLTPVSLR